MIRKAFLIACLSGAACPNTNAATVRLFWPELEETLRARTAHRTIPCFLHPETDQLFVYVEIESEERWGRRRTD